MALAFAVVTATVAIAACESDEPSARLLLGDGCVLNSDCDAGLVCVFERCHIECNSSADCPLGPDGDRLRCVLGVQPDHVCQLPDEASCAYHSECPGQQICGPDGACRDQCQADRDCVEGQLCVSGGVCADADELDADGRLPAVPPPAGQETGYPCSYTSECVGLAPAGGPEFVCRAGACNYACYTLVDCDPGFICEPADGDPSTPGSCVPPPPSPCVPGVQIGCPCYPDNSAGFQVCMADGSGYGECISAANGQPCSPPEP